LNVTDLGLIVLGDLFREHNIIADGDNSSRFPEIFLRKKKPGEPNYQGAVVYIEQRGLFKPVLKADYSSMYPSIVAAFSLSPDTTTLLRYDKYQKNGFRIEEDKDTFTYFIPDNALRKNVVLQVVKKTGFLSETVDRFLKERAKYKAEYKKTGSKIARARSDIAKVKANGGIYGVMGAAHHPFGFAPIAVATTGIGRECAKLLINVLDTLYPKSVIEVDTDGVYFTAEEYNKERIIHYFNDALKKKFKKDLNLTIDIDDYPAGYFHKAKNYILLTKEGNVILHGAAMKASSKDGISKKLIQDLARAKLEGKSTDSIVLRYKNLQDFQLSDFAMQVTLGRRIHEYKSINCIPVNIAMQAQKAFNIKPQVGNVHHYVKTIYGYQLFQLAKKDDLDLKYYSKKIDKIVKMFELEYELTAPIGSFIGKESESWEQEEDTKIVEKKAPMRLDDFL